MKFFVWILVLILIQLFTESVHAESPPSKPISLATIDGRDWLVDSHGNPFFAHGITHASNNRNAFDFTEFSTACSGLVSTPMDTAVLPSQGDMPYLESGTILFLFRLIEISEAFISLIFLIQKNKSGSRLG